MTPDGVEALGRLIPSLAVLALALVGLRWWLRRQGGPGGQQLVRVVSRTGLSRGALLAVVQVGERRLLLGVTDHAVSLVTELPPGAAELDLTGAGGAASSYPPATDAGAAPAEAGAYAGPRMGLVDRLREMTVRSAPPRPPRARR